MDPLLNKLNFKGHSDLLILNAPSGVLESIDHPLTAKDIHDPSFEDGVGFALVFIKDQASLRDAVPVIIDRMAEDAVLWFAYPKKSSRSLRSDIDRDHGWEPLESRGFFGVRQVSIDEDWSALRFRHRDHIRRRV